MIDSQDPKAWNMLFRVEIEKRLGSVRADLARVGDAPGTTNIPGQLRNALFPNEKARAVLHNSLEGEQLKNLKWLDEALQIASTGRPGGSQTGIRTVIMKEYANKMVQVLRDFIGKPIESTINIGAEEGMNINIRAAARLMFDPSFTPQMKTVRSVPQESKLASRAFLHSLNFALVKTIEELKQEDSQPQGKIK